VTAELDRIRSLHAGITPGLWEARIGSYSTEGIDYSGGYIPGVCEEYHDGDGYHAPLTEEDAAFIAAAPSTVTHLLAMIERIEALHPKTCEINGDRGCEHGDACPVLVCGPCGEPWPCPTIAAISGEVAG